MNEIKNDTAPTSAELIAMASAGTLRANGNLLACILMSLPAERKDALQRLLDGGGSIGIETLVDGKAQNTIHLVGIEREGARLVLATVKPDTPGAVH